MFPEDENDDTTATGLGSGFSGLVVVTFVIVMSCCCGCCCSGKSKRSFHTVKITTVGLAGLDSVACS